MARRRMGRGTKTLILAAGLGVGGYIAYRAGAWDWLMAKLAGGGSQQANGQGNGQGNGTENGDGSWFSALLASLAGLFKKQNGNGNGGGFTLDDLLGLFKKTNDADVQPSLPPPSDATIPDVNGTGAGSTDATLPAAALGITFPTWLGGVTESNAFLPAARIPELLAKLAAPVIAWASGPVLHEINVALPGPNTGLEKGNLTLMSTSGAFIFNPTSGKCYDLAGRAIVCPGPSEIIGVEKHTLEWYADKATG